MSDLEFINPNSHPIQIAGPNRETITFKKFEKKILPSWFTRYCPRYLTVVDSTTHNMPKKIGTRSHPVKAADPEWQERRQQALARQKNREKRRKRNRPVVRRTPTLAGRKVVGRREHRGKEATAHFQRLLKIASFPISNNIGVGILSYNRLKCVQRLIESIRKRTNLDKTTVFVSDESSDQKVKKWLRQQKDIVLVDNDQRLGIAGNSNRLLRCLERFEYKILLNDDVEVLKDGWDTLYPNLMKEMNYHHFCMRQPGVHGASEREGKVAYINDIPIQTIEKKPHGAVLAFDSLAFQKVGYFDEDFGLYGIEHVDWSNRISLSGIQPSGFHDALGSELFFKIHGGNSSIPSSERAVALRKSREKFARLSKDKSRIHVSASAKTKVPEVTFVVPFQGNNRSPSINTVIQNVRAQRFPRIEIIAVEQDERKQVRFDERGLKYLLAKASRRQAFTKAIAFNLGVSKAGCANIVLHDADMLVQADYARRVMSILESNDSCHIGSRVMYMTAQSTNVINREHRVDSSMTVLRSVGYFEGGSLACKRDKFYYIGGFNEEFVGYGVEDCEFFERLKALTKMYDKRNIDLLHLAHGRTDGWESCHRRNKMLYSKIAKKSMDQRRADLALRFKKKYL